MERQMLKGRSILIVLSALLCCCLSARAAKSITLESAETALPSWADTTIQPVSSPNAGEIFFEIASELAESENITAAKAEQAILLLIAAKELGCTIEQIRPLLITLAT